MVHSKEDKKALKKKYKEDIQNAFWEFLIISPKLSTELLSKKLIPEINSLGISCSLVSTVSPNRFELTQPNNSERKVTIELGTIEDEDWLNIQELEDLMENSLDDLRGEACVKVSSQGNLSPVNDLLYTTVKRALGRLTKGVHVSNGAIMDDWLAWSLDYMGDSMADVSRVYDNECPNFIELISKYPDLEFKKPWWKRIIS